MDLARGLDAPLSPDSEIAARTVGAAFGPATRAIVHYGSRVHGARVLESSEFDFVVVTDDYPRAMKSVVSETQQRFSSASGAILSRVLAPSIIAIPLHLHGREQRAKCVVYSSDDFQRACSASAPDHFLKGRLFQNVTIAFTRDEQSLHQVRSGIVECRRGTVEWAQASLPERFDEGLFFRTLLEVSYAAEIRPEQKTRIREVYSAQSTTMLPIFRELLLSLAEAGQLRSAGNDFILNSPPTAARKAAIKRYFRKSKLRAIARWPKSAWLYRGWIDYLKQKMNRRILKPARGELEC